MWGNQKKPETPQVAPPEPKNFSTNQPPKPAPATWEGTNAMSTDAMRPLGATAECDHWVRRRTVQPHGSDRASILKVRSPVTKIC